MNKCLKNTFEELLKKKEIKYEYWHNLFSEITDILYKNDTNLDDLEELYEHWQKLNKIFKQITKLLKKYNISFKDLKELFHSWNKLKIVELYNSDFSKTSYKFKSERYSKNNIRHSVKSKSKKKSLKKYKN